MPTLPYGDLALGTSGDIEDPTRTVTGVDAVIQRLVGRLRVVRGEWFLDDTAGVPWNQIMASKPPNRALAQAYIAEVAAGTPGIQAVRSCSVSVTESTRNMQAVLDLQIEDSIYRAQFNVSGEGQGNTSPYIYSRVLPRV